MKTDAGPIAPPPPGDAPSEWLTTPESGWRVAIAPTAMTRRSFVSGEPNGDRLRVHYYRPSDNSTLLAKVWFGPGTQGPPGHAHGGSMAAALDELMGAAVWFAGHPAVAAELTTRFRRMLPLGSCCIAEARVISVAGRKIRTEAQLRDRVGTVIAEGEALFVEVDSARFAELAASADGTFGDTLEPMKD